MSIEKLPSGKYRAVVRHAGAKRASEAVPTVAVAKILEAELKLAMGGTASTRATHTVGEVVTGYISDSSHRLSPGSVNFYRNGDAAMPESFRSRPVRDVTPLVLDGMYAELREEGRERTRVSRRRSRR